MAYKQYRADVSKSLLVLNPEQIPSSADNFSASGSYTPDFTLLDAKNVLPSTTGYFSFFGKDVDFDDPLAEGIQDIITVRTLQGDTILFALCPSGLWMKSIVGAEAPTLDIQTNIPSTDPNDPPRARHLIGWVEVTMPQGKCKWTNLISSPLGSPNPWALWTWAIVNNNLYFYQQGLGYIAHFYGLEKNKVQIDKLEPFYIIGTVPQYRWTISAQDADAACTDTWKALSIAGMGEFRLDYLDKAHYVADVVARWQESTLGFLGAGFQVTETSAVITPIDGSFHLDVTPTGEGLRRDYTMGDESAPTQVALFYNSHILPADTTSKYIGSWLATTSSTPFPAQFDFALVVINPYYPSPTHFDILSAQVGPDTAYVDIIDPPSWAGSENYSTFEFYLARVRGASATTGTLALVIPATGSLTFNWQITTGYPVAEGYPTTTVMYNYPCPWGPSYPLDACEDPVWFPDSLFWANSHYTFGYRINSGTIINLPTDGAPIPQNGNVNIPVAAGDIFELILHNEAPVEGLFALLAVISNFSAPSAPTGPVDLPASITLQHDGEPDELTSSWNAETGDLTVGGFKRFGLTTVHILVDGEMRRTFAVPSIYDSNDLFTLLTTELQAAAVGYTVTPTLTTPASAVVDYELTISYVDFEDGAPFTPILTHDGDCLWSLTGNETAQLALAQVSGITSARGRLAAWDRENAIYLSSNQDPVDFTPDIATQANIGKAQPVQGNIIFCAGWNNGFIIYSSGNVTRATYTGGTYVFEYRAIADTGVIDPRHITGNLDSHFYWSNRGLIEVDTEKGEVQEIAPEILDWLNQHPYPIKVSYIGDRFLVLGIIAQIDIRSSAQVRQSPEPGISTLAAGLGPRPIRQPTLVSLLSFPFGSNLFTPYVTSLVYDSVLKKWGTCSEPTKAIFSLSPVNAKGFPAEKSPERLEKFYFNRVRSLAGVLADDSTILFNDNPDDSYLCFGHAKFTVAESSRLIRVVAEFVDYPKAQIQVENSFDGVLVDWNDIATSPLAETPIITFDLDAVGDWFNILIRGNYHLRSFTIRGYKHANL